MAVPDNRLIWSAGRGVPSGEKLTQTIRNTATPGRPRQY
jgi:hypothetical protein